MKNKIIYLDNAAQMLIPFDIKNNINDFLKETLGNPSSEHKLGIKSKKIIDNTRSIIANYLKVNDNEIIFTSGATESINMSLFGLFHKYKYKGNHVITSKVEHNSTIMIFKYFENNGIKVTYLDVDKNGMISLNDLKNSITDKTIFASFTFVNNETGVILPVKAITKILNKIPLHIDATQAFGKINIHPKKLGISLMTMSGHKIGALAGIGVLYIDDNIKIPKLILGSKQELNMRAGTENLLGIKSLELVLKKRIKNYQSNICHIYKLNKYLKISLIKLFNKNIIFNGKNTIPNIISISFKDIIGDLLVRQLQEKEIFISTSSACNKNKVSHVLKAMKINTKYILGTIRISFSPENCLNDIEIFLKNISEILKN